MSNFIQRKVVDKNLIEEFSNLVGCGKDLAEVLLMRGYDDENKVKSFLHTDIANLTPVFNYNGMKEASLRIKQAVDNQESVVIYGDYDCDGVCATSILYLFLMSLGVNVNYYIPSRKKEGYGINRDALEEIASEYYPDLIITVDCGVTAKEDIEYAINDLGIDFVVTDHHEPPQDLPDCIVIDPKIDRKPNCFNELCGAGIALRLCEAVGGTKALMYYIDICAIATIGDIVPLVDDNRIIVSYGMDIINARARLSCKLLLEVAGVKPEEKVTSTDVAFKIVPRINAIGRLSDSRKAVEMIVDSDYFYVKSLAEQANEYNRDRQVYTDDLVKDALRLLENYDLVNNKIIVLYSEKWEAGVLGIASAKITKMFNRPSILLTLDGELYKGSARSVEGINIYECVSACKSFLQTFGGHKMACGVSVHKDNIESFVFAINEYARRFDKSLFLPRCEYDLQRNFNDIDFNSIKELQMLEPCGMDNPRVKYKIDINNPDFSKISLTKHIKMARDEEVELVYFDGLQNMLNLNDSSQVQVVSDLSIRTFANRTYAQGIVEDVQFDWNNYEIDEDYLAIKYAYNTIYPNESVFNIKYIDENQVINQVENDLYGVCFLAYSQNTFKKYQEILKDVVMQTDNKVVSEVNPFNRLVLDLDLSQNLKYYKKIVILDTLPSLGVIDYLKLNINAEVFMVKDNLATNYIEKVKANYPDLNKMREIFVNVRNVLAKNTKITTFAELYTEYKKRYDCNAIQVYTALFVFYELKILKLKGGFFVDNQVKTSLENSTIYNKIKELILCN